MYIFHHTIVLSLILVVVLKTNKHFIHSSTHSFIKAVEWQVKRKKDGHICHTIQRLRSDLMGQNCHSMKSYILDWKVLLCLVIRQTRQVYTLHMSPVSHVPLKNSDSAIIQILIKCKLLLHCHNISNFCKCQSWSSQLASEFKSVQVSAKRGPNSRFEANTKSW